MKFKILIPLGFCLAILFSSCLKDTPFMDVSNTQPIIEFGQSPAQGLSGPFAYGGDTANSPLIDTAIALVVASPQVLNTSVTTTIAIDPTQIAALDTSISQANVQNGTSNPFFTMLPSNLYTLASTTISILPGYRVGRIPVVLNFPNFPASHYNYALPIKIVSATTASGDSLIVSGNSGTFMWLFSQ